MIDVYLLLGSNLGDRQGYLRQAIDLIEKEIAPASATSSVYETQSWGKTDEPDYLNQVICIKTDLLALTVLDRILHIELNMGRRREVKWGSRIIDIDILFYGGEIINEPNLVVPHPQLHNRMFTLAPLTEIAPDLVHPLLNKHIFELKTELKNNLHVKKL
jgi:2-amino-4-hydroxy-6-hydroxymethyldihydropteridine diphosphokinase